MTIRCIITSTRINLASLGQLVVDDANAEAIRVG